MMDMLIGYVGCIQSLRIWWGGTVFIDGLDNS